VQIAKLLIVSFSLFSLTYSPGWKWTTQKNYTQNNSTKLPYQYPIFEAHTATRSVQWSVPGSGKSRD